MFRRLPLTLFLTASCTQLGELPPDEHVVAAPISARANVVLANLVEEHGSKDGAWSSCMSPGCVELWATQFGYRAGVRRRRDDLVALGRSTAAREASALRKIALSGGAIDASDPAVQGFPALFVSATLGRRGLDALLFEKALEHALDARETLDGRERSALATLLAASTEVSPEKKVARLTIARDLAATTGEDGGGTWRFLARAAIARASGNVGDETAARASLAATGFRFDELGRLELPIPTADEVLSRILSLAHGLADLTAATGDARLHRAALSVLDYVFSDAYFDGHFLIHDRVLGPSEDVCSGCNFMALYLVDRLYGDSFVIAPLPALPTRDAPGPSSEPEDGVLVLGANGRCSATFEALAPEGHLRFEHEHESAWIEVRYRLQPVAGVDGVAIEVRSFFDGVVEYGLLTGFDGSGRARFALGTEPLFATLTFVRSAPDALSADVELWEQDPDGE